MYDITLTELKSQWLGEEVLSNALAAVNNLTYYAAKSGPWLQNCEKITTSKLNLIFILCFSHTFLCMYGRVCALYAYVPTYVRMLQYVFGSISKYCAHTHMFVHTVCMYV